MERRSSRGESSEREGRSSRGRDDRDDDRGRDRGRGRDDERGGRDRGSSGFSYTRRTAEEVNKRSSMGGKDYDNILIDAIKMWKPNDGANTIRILPPTWPKPEHYGLDIWVHYSVGPDQQSYLCLHKMKGETCPICEERDRARRAGEDEDYVKELEPTRRVLFYLVDRDHESDGVQAWAAPWTIDRDITKISVDRKTNEVLPIDDPEEGYDVEFDRTGKGVNTKYVGVAIARRESKLGKAAWLDFAVDNPLPQTLQYFDEAHIEKVFGGGGGHRSRRDKDDDKDSRDTRRGRDDRDDDRDSRGRGRDNDRERERENERSPRGRRDEPEYTWESIHAMEGPELDALVDDKKLNINPDKANSDDELADWICEELKIDKPREERTQRRGGRDEDEGASRLRSMREGRKD